MDALDIMTHLRSRGMNPSLYQCYIDDGTATFLLWNLSGQLVGYQQYRRNGDKEQCNDRDVGKYYTYTRDNLAVWGLETFYWRNDILFVTEGIFDAVKLHNLGLPTVAVLQNNPKRMKTWLYAIPRTTIAICDNDQNNSGKKLGNSCQISLMVPNLGQDLGDMSKEQVVDFLRDKLPQLKL